MAGAYIAGMTAECHRLSLAGVSVLAFAHAVVGKRADNVAILDRMAMAMRDDALQLMLQLLQAGDFFTHMGEVFGSDTVRPLARHLPVLAERDQLTNGVDIEPDIAGVADEGQRPAFRDRFFRNGAGYPPNVPPRG